MTGGGKLLKVLGWKRVDGEDKLTLGDGDYDASELKEAKRKVRSGEGVARSERRGQGARSERRG